MKRELCAILLAGISLVGPAGVSAGEVRLDEPLPAEKTENRDISIGSEDREVIRMMELLQLMDLLRDMEMLEGETTLVSEDEK